MQPFAADMIPSCMHGNTTHIPLWQDTCVMTLLSNVTFVNYAYQPQLGTQRQSVFYTMIQSDEYKPAVRGPGAQGRWGMR